MNWELNKRLVSDPKAIVPLVGFSDLPHGFQFRLNMHQFGGMRCFAVISVHCLADLMIELGVGPCPLLVHEAIYEQAHLNQISLRWADKDDLPALVEVFSKHQCQWEQFDKDRI